jgi:endonuclease/exonuclease/phosphatase family metal-dependent hydrolase
VITPLEGVSFPIRRGYGLVHGELDGTRVLVANTHLEAYDAEVRDAQRDELLAALADADGPVAVVGDFNARPDAVGVGAPYSDAWLAAGGDPGGGVTCGQRADLRNGDSALDQRIDYVFVRNADVEFCRVVGDQPQDRSSGAGLWPSDHAGVVARIQF